MKKRLFIGFWVSAMVFPLLSQAGHRTNQTSFRDYAEVISAEPVIKVVEVSTPRDECWQQRVHRPMRRPGHSNSAGGMIVGGVIGGVVGNQFGKGRGKDIATLAGTLVGASLGHDHAVNHKGSRRQDRASYEHHCRTFNDYHSEERVDGYRVVYRYNGETFKTRLPYDPGESLRVKISVTPLK